MPSTIDSLIDRVRLGGEAQITFPNAPSGDYFIECKYKSGLSQTPPLFIIYYLMQSTLEQLLGYSLVHISRSKGMCDANWCSKVEG
jgi:hypothetical protein